MHPLHREPKDRWFAPKKWLSEAPREEPRKAISLAQTSGLWALDGVDASAPAPPRPPKRLPWRGTTPDPDQVVDLQRKFAMWKEKDASEQREL